MIDYHFPNFIIIKVVSLNPGGEQTEVKFSKVLYTHTTKLLLPTNKIPIQ
jgi:hypothetical protein